MTNSKVKHIWSILYEDVTVDTNSNKLSLFNTLEEVTIDVRNNEQAKKALDVLRKDDKDFIIPVKFVLASLWLYDISKNESLDLRVEFVGHDKKLIWFREYNVRLDKGKNKTRNILRFKGLQIPKHSGMCLLSLKLKKGKSYKKFTEIPVGIKILE